MMRQTRRAAVAMSIASCIWVIFSSFSAVVKLLFPFLSPICAAVAEIHENIMTSDMKRMIRRPVANGDELPPRGVIKIMYFRILFEREKNKQISNSRTVVYYDSFL